MMIVIENYQMEIKKPSKHDIEPETSKANYKRYNSHGMKKNARISLNSSRCDLERSCTIKLVLDNGINQGIC